MPGAVPWVRSRSRLLCRAGTVRAYIFQEYRIHGTGGSGLKNAIKGGRVRKVKRWLRVAAGSSSAKRFNVETLFYDLPAPSLLPASSLFSLIFFLLSASHLSPRSLLVFIPTFEPLACIPFLRDSICATQLSGSSVKERSTEKR